MCGIFGVINYSKKIDKAREARDVLTHRGPDNEGEFYDNSVYLGHRRLSILDLSNAGSQPMQTEDVKIIANGEIYNFKEIKKELEKKHHFKSNSDSEVILHGYQEWGIVKLLSKLEGMFAFSIYDKKNNKVYLARDRAGIKPLYYGIQNAEFVFASELKALDNYYDNLEINDEAIYDFLTYQYIPTPKTIFKECFKLPPAHYLEYNIKEKKHTVNQYWKLSYKIEPISLEDAKTKLIKLFTDSINSQMISDVPLGFFLSGGIDSSCVVSLASKSHDNIHTYSIGFDVEEFSEIKYAKQIAELFKTQHNEKILTLSKTTSLKNSYTNWYDEPHADTSAFPTYLVSQFAKENSTVVLTGDGGDELFGGYSIYKKFEKRIKRATPKLKFLRNTLEKIKYRWSEKIIENFLLDDLELYTTLNGSMPLKERMKYRTKLNIPDDYDDYWYYKKFYIKELEPKTRLQYMEFHTSMHDDILTKVDRTSMAVSLETRVPILDTKIMEFAFSLPPEIRYHNNELKGILKVALEPILPHEILYRKKKGFGIPLGAWGFKDGKHTTLKILEMFNLEKRV